MKSIPIRKDDEVQVDYYLLLRRCTTSTMCAPFRSARTMRCRSTDTFSLELRHKYNVRFIPIRKDDEVQVDCCLLLRSYVTSPMCAPSRSARTTRYRSTSTFSFGATPQIQKLSRVKNKFHSTESSQRYSTINQVQINPKGPRPQIKVLEPSARQSLTVTKSTRHSEANLK